MCFFYFLNKFSVDDFVYLKEEFPVYCWQKINYHFSFMTKGGKKKDQISPNSLNSWHLNFMHQSLFIIGKSRTKKI